MDDISVYKDLEQSLNSFSDGIDLEGMHLNIPHFKQRWSEQKPKPNEDQDQDQDHAAHEHDDDIDSKEFIPQGRDIVKQLLAGLGFRITGMSSSSTTNTKNLLVTTKDPNGVQFVISAVNHDSDSSTEGVVNGDHDHDQHEGANKNGYRHFDSTQIDQFYDQHAGRQGIAVLGFQITDGDIDSLHERYKALHPKLITKDCEGGAVMYNEDDGVTKVLEVYSYYKNEKGGEVDEGTKLRFVQRINKSGDGLILPGFVPVEATFDKTCMSAYCDHWVSNVMSRTGFIETLEETLGFTPKVDFNAGVVAAGEAQIESTVTGNDSDFVTDDREKALRDQSQVYLPINNAVSDVGHVSGFLKEIGNGVQHIASRVDDLPAFVQRGNDFRKITGEGFTFLKIPRSYYGVLTAKLLKDSVDLSDDCANAVMECCEASGFMSLEGGIDLQLTPEQLCGHLDDSLDEDIQKEFEANKDLVLDTILRSRYINLYVLLGDLLSTETYLSIVRNQILVDVQGNDLLFQIFTSNVLQRKVGDESPFLEFIQRVCADCTDDGCPLGMKAGCGGFGIRNFLTLFLSIEVGKAMLDSSRAKAAGDVVAMNFAHRKVDIFTEQLNEANPILTAITDAMTAEGKALEKMQDALARGDEAAASTFEETMKRAADDKHASNEKLMECSSKYNELMKSLRLAGSVVS